MDYNLEILIANLQNQYTQNSMYDADDKDKLKVIYEMANFIAKFTEVDD